MTLLMNPNGGVSLKPAFRYFQLTFYDVVVTRSHFSFASSLSNFYVHRFGQNRRNPGFLAVSPDSEKQLIARERNVDKLFRVS